MDISHRIRFDFGVFPGRPGGGDSARKEREGGAEPQGEDGGGARSARAGRAPCGERRSASGGAAAGRRPPRPAFRPVRLARPRIGSDSGGDGSGHRGGRRYRGASWPPPSVQNGWTCLEPEQTGTRAAFGAEPGKAGAPRALTTFGHAQPQKPTCSYVCRMLCSAPSRRGGENIPVRSFRRKRRGPPCPTAPTRAAPSTICTRKSNSFTQNLDNSSRTIGCRGARVAHLSSDFRDLAVQSHV